MSSDLIWRIVFVCIALWLIWFFLIPLLPAPFGTIVMVIVVVAVVIWLLKQGKVIT